MTTNAGFLELGLSDDPEFLVGGLGVPTDAFIRIVELASGTVDTGSTPNTSLRRGLLVNDQTVPGGPWINGGWGTTEVLGFLWTPTNMLNALGAAENKHQIMVLRGGTIKESALPEGTLAAGDKTALEAQTDGNFIFV